MTTAETHAPTYSAPAELGGVFWFSTVTALVLAFSIGANDVANNFGTSVGSGAVSLRTAALVAGVAEVLGAVTLGSGVSDTIVRGISDLDPPQCWGCGGGGGARTSLLMLGMACALAAGAAFLLAATFAAMPVSTTHSVVGAVLGMTLVSGGPGCVLWGWPGLASICASWALSPALSGLLSAALLLYVKSFVLGGPDPAGAALGRLPALGGLTVAMFAALLLLKARATRHWPAWASVLAATALGLGGAALTRAVAVPRLRRTCRPSALASVQLSVLRKDGKGGDGGSSPGESGGHDGGGSGSSDPRLRGSLPGSPRGGEEGGEEEAEGALTGSDGSSDGGDRQQEELAAAAEKIFMFLQVFTASLKSYAHGANDTANAAGPYTAVQALYIHGAAGCSHVVTPFWVLAAGGLGIVLGLACLGHKVMQTIGTGLTSINFSRGFCVELGSTLAVVTASLAGMPVSSTHCQVGSIIAVGLMESGAGAVNWRLLGKVAVSWLVTVPAAAAAAALLLVATRPLIVS